MNNETENYERNFRNSKRISTKNTDNIKHLGKVKMLNDKSTEEKIKLLFDKCLDKDPEERQSGLEELINSISKEDLYNYLFTSKLEDKNNFRKLRIHKVFLEKLLSDSVEYSLEYAVDFIYFNRFTFFNTYINCEHLNNYTEKDIENITSINLYNESNELNDSNENKLFNLGMIFNVLVKETINNLSSEKLQIKVIELISLCYECMMNSQFEDDFNSVCFDILNEQLLSKNKNKVINTIKIIKSLLSNFGIEIFEFRRLMNNIYSLTESKFPQIRQEIHQLLSQFVMFYPELDRKIILSKIEKNVDNESFVSLYYLSQSLIIYSQLINLYNHIQK